MHFYWPFMRLSIENGELVGKRMWLGRVYIRPEDIREAREYTGNNPFLGLVTSEGNYTISVFRREYACVLDHVESKTGLRVTGSPGFEMNRGFYPWLAPSKRLTARASREKSVSRTRRRLGCALMGILLVCVGLPSFFSVMSFLDAEPASHLVARGYTVPETWSAGVENHGSYYQWWMIEERPMLFGLSLLGLVIGIGPAQGFVIWLAIAEWKWPGASRKANELD